MTRCETCDQAERISVHRAKMVERDGRVAVVTGVPMQECPACGSRWMSMDIAEMLDEILRRLIDSGAETATAHWADLAPTGV